MVEDVVGCAVEYGSVDCVFRNGDYDDDWPDAFWELWVDSFWWVGVCFCDFF